MDDLLTAHSIACLLMLGRDAGHPPETLRRCKQLLDHAEADSAKQFDHYMDSVRMLDPDPNDIRLTQAYQRALAMVANGATFDDLDELSVNSLALLKRAHARYASATVIPPAPPATLTQEGQDREEGFHAMHKQLSSL